EVLRRSEEEKSEAQRLSFAGSFRWRSEARELSWSAELARIFGIDPSRRPSRKLLRSRLHPEDHEVVVSRARELEREGATLDLDRPDLAEAREAAARVVRFATRAADVITRLRALFRKSEAGSEPVDLNDAIQDVIGLARREMQRARVSIGLDIADALPSVLG